MAAKLDVVNIFLSRQVLLIAVWTVPLRQTVHILHAKYTWTESNRYNRPRFKALMSSFNRKSSFSAHYPCVCVLGWHSLARLSHMSKRLPRHRVCDWGLADWTVWPLHLRLWQRRLQQSGRKGLKHFMHKLKMYFLNRNADVRDIQISFCIC